MSISADPNILFTYRLLSNFEHCEGSLTAVRQILSDTQNEKENIHGSVSSSTIGQLIKQLWGDKVRLVKRGSKNQRQNFYLNLKKKSVDVVVKSASCTSSTFQNGCWQLVEDQGTKTSFHRFFPWLFKNQRGSVELRVEEDGENSSRYHIASRGCDIDITDMIDKDLEKFSLLERVENIFQILDTSTVCKGVQVKDGEVLNSVIPHQSGLFNDGPVEEKRAFSNKCSLLCSAGKQCCSQCQKIKRNSDERNKRKLELGGMVHPKTNKRFMSKDDYAKQLQLERQARINATKREKYWREKFEGECLEMTEDDNADLTTMFQSAHNNIPEHMAGLWEQQKLLLSSKSKNAYRWHPKLVFSSYA